MIYIRELWLRQDIKALININNRRISVEDRQEGKLQRESSATKQYDAGELWCHRTLLGKGIKGQSALEMHIKGKSDRKKTQMFSPIQGHPPPKYLYYQSLTSKSTPSELIMAPVIFHPSFQKCFFFFLNI